MSREMKVGIVTISYNQQRFLGEAISSVVGSRYSGGLKYVVVDAGSQDGSVDLILSRKNDIDITVLEPDAGPGDGLNKGFGHCTDCEILGYINSDDRLVPGALPTVQSFFREHPDVDVLQGAIALIDEDGHPSPRSRVCDTFNLRRYLKGACNVFQQGTFFRRAIFSRTLGFNPLNRTCWDTELIVDMALAGARFESTLVLLGEFRIHKDSITGSGHLYKQYMEDQHRIREKIKSAGVPSHSQFRGTLARALHRINPSRQASYFLTRRPSIQLERRQSVDSPSHA